jgi:predicted nucleic acid-binding protein
MIAAVAVRQQAAVLTCDVDFSHIARVVGIDLDPV